MSSSAMRAVNGVIGSYRMTSQTARSAYVSGSLRQELPLVGMRGEQPHRVGELRLGRVDASDQDVQDQVDQLVVGQPVAVLLGRDQKRDQVVAGIGAAGIQQPVRIVVELEYGLLDLRPLGQDVLGELLLDPVRPVVQALGVRQRRAHHRRDRHCGVRLGEVRDELAAAGRGHRLVELLDEAPDGRAIALDGARGQRRVDQRAQPPVIRSVDAEDVLDDLLVQRAFGDAEQLGHQRARELELLRLEEEVDALAIEHEAPERRLREPALGAQIPHARVERLAPQGRVEVVELGKLELRDEGHRESTLPGFRTPATRQPN